MLSKRGHAKGSSPGLRPGGPPAPGFRRSGSGEARFSQVVMFMQQIGLSQYSDVLLKHGFDDFEILMDVQDSHLKAMGFLPGHMLKIKKRLKEHQTAAPSTASSSPQERSAGPAGCINSRVVCSSPSLSAFPPRAPSREVMEVVSQSWKQVEEKVLEIADSMYKHLFLLAPDVPKLFPVSVRNRYRDWASPIDEVENDFENSSALPQIWSKVICAIGSSISGLRNPSKLVSDLNALGMRHAGYNVKEEHFALLGDALLAALRQHLDQGLTCEVEQSWMTVYDFIANATKFALQSVSFQKRALKETQLRPGGTATAAWRTGATARTPGSGKAEAKKFAPMGRNGVGVKQTDEMRNENCAKGAPVAHQVPSTASGGAPGAAGAAPLGLLPSQRQILTVQQSWLAVKELGIANVGELLYKHLFRIAPVTKKLFPLSVRMRYRDWTTSAEEVEDDFDNSPALRNLFAKVVEAVGTAVAGLHNVSRLVFELNALGMRHINYNMQEEYFEYGGQALVLTLQDGLGPDLSPEVKQAWISVYEFISANIISGLRFAREKENLLKKLQVESSSRRSSERSSWSTTAASAASAGSEDSFDEGL